MVKVNTYTSNYKNVNRLYPNGMITGIKEICFNNGGWVKASYTNTFSNRLSEIVEQLKPHAESIQLEITDQYGAKKYPDYKLKELTNH